MATYQIACLAADRDAALVLAQGEIGFTAEFSPSGEYPVTVYMGGGGIGIGGIPAAVLAAFQADPRFSVSAANVNWSTFATSLGVQRIWPVEE